MPPIPVIAGIIRDARGHILLCQRESGALEGQWEFPGGKIEEGETPEECLQREIYEELNIVIAVGPVYKVVHTAYKHGDFLLIGFLARYMHGEISLRFHRDVDWVHPRKLLHYPLAEANVPIAVSLKEEANPARSCMGADCGADNALDDRFGL